MITGGLIVGSMALSAYSTYQNNKIADARANAANANNYDAYMASIRKSEYDNKNRQEELLRRFNVTSGKVKDSVNDLYQSTALKISDLDLQVLKAKSVTDNVNAAKHINGRLAERLQNIVDVKALEQKGNIIQGTEQGVREVNNKLEAMRSDLESKQENIDIDFSNAIATANNNYARGISYSNSSGTLGVIASGMGGAAQGASLASAYYRLGSSYNNYQTTQAIGGLNA